MRAVGLATHIYNNMFKSALLLAGYPFLLFFMVWLFWFLLGYFSLQEPNFSVILDTASKAFYTSVTYIPYVLIFTAIWFTIAYFFHSKMIRMASGSVPVTRKEYPKLYNMLENLCISRGLPMPKFEIIDSPAMNAFASGLTEKDYTITLTRGIVETLPDDELEAVIGHELTHIMNRDVRLLVISIIFVGMISFFAQLFFRSLVYGGSSRYRYRSSRSRSNDNRGGGAIIIIALVVLVIGYIFAILIRFSLSRKREYLADAGSVELTKNPEAMMRALMRISGHDKVDDMPDEIQQMCIENSHNFMGIFATHPPIEDRIKTISKMTGTPIPRLSVSLKRRPRSPWKDGIPKEK